MDKKSPYLEQQWGKKVSLSVSSRKFHAFPNLMTLFLIGFCSKMDSDDWNQV